MSELKTNNARNNIISLPLISWAVFIGSITICLKGLTFNFYHSTDFEVHRNWKAITYQLPISKWYYDTTSEWTLDYPPLFAIFECLLSQLAAVIDPGIVTLKNLNYDSVKAKVFLHGTVMCSDLVLVYGTYSVLSGIFQLKSNMQLPMKSPIVTTLMLVLCNSSLFIVDHIHFQYNGFLFGILFISIGCLVRHQFLECALWFSMLLLLKHLFLVMAPAFFLVLFKFGCFKDFNISLANFRVGAFFRLGIVGISFIIATLFPWILMGQIPQLLSRLFPFKRGLVHAYWAPNFWAVYVFCDRAIGKFLSHYNPGYVPSESLTRGLVGDTVMSVLPTIEPWVCACLTIMSVVTGFGLYWRSCGEHKRMSLDSVFALLIHCSFSAFAFGWHVHEKAALNFALPMILSLNTASPSTTRVIVFTAVIVNVAIMPLVTFDLFACILAFVSICLYAYVLLWLIPTEYAAIVRMWMPGESFDENEWPEVDLIHYVEFVYLALAHMLPVLCALWPIVMGNAAQFLPLMLTSVYCSVGILYAWILYFKYTLLE